MELIYLDNAATTRTDERVVEAIASLFLPSIMEMHLPFMHWVRKAARQ